MDRMNQMKRTNLGIGGVEKYAFRRGRNFHFELEMGAKSKQVRELHILQIENRNVFPLLANNERFGGILLRENQSQGRRVKVLAAPFVPSLESYLATHLPPAATFYDLAAKGASVEELNQAIHSLKQAQTFNMPLLICGGEDHSQKLDEYKFADFWNRITAGGLQRRLSGLRTEWGHKLSMFDQFMNVAWGMVLLLRERDPYTAVHSVYVAMCAYLIGEKMGMTPLELEFLKIGGIYHDVGKIGIRDEVLRKPDQLSEEEFKHMRQHPLKGLLATSLLTQGLNEWDGWAQSLQGVEREHHLRYDGKGYPATTKRPDEISLFTWIIGMADALDAMTTMRSYVKGNPQIEEKIRDIEANKGKQFHPRVAEACLELLSEGMAVKTKLPLPKIANI